MMSMNGHMGVVRALLVIAFILACSPAPAAHTQSGPTWLWLTMNQTQSVPSGAFTTLAWDTVSGKSGWPQVATPVSTVVIPTSGIWEVWVRDVDFGDRGHDVGSRGVYLRVNGDTNSTRAIDIRGAAGVLPTASGGAILKYFQAGDQVEVRVRHTAGMSLQVGAVEVWLWLREPGAQSFAGVN